MVDTMQNTVYELRTSQKKTQEDLAKAVDVSRQTIIAIEKGNYIPSLLLAIRIANYFNTPVESIFRICKK